MSNNNMLSVKVVKSCVKSDHSAVIVYDGSPIIKVLKQKRVVTFRRKAPQQHAVFLIAAFDFNPVMNSDNVQACADRFHKIANELLILSK